MKIALFADKFVGLEVLKYFIENFKDDIALLIVTEENAIFSHAKSFHIPTKIWNPNTLESMRALHVDLGILAWWPKIIKSELIHIPRQGFINFHPSYLPYNKGKHYNFWAIVENAPFGVTLHRVDEGIDTGDIVAQKEINYDWSDTGESLFLKAQSEIIDLFKNTYPSLRITKIDKISTPQQKSQGSFHYANEINEICKIDLNKTYNARFLLNLLRARTFDNHPACNFIDETGTEYEVRVKITRKEK